MPRHPSRSPRRRRHPHGVTGAATVLGLLGLGLILLALTLFARLT